MSKYLSRDIILGALASLVLVAGLALGAWSLLGGRAGQPADDATVPTLSEVRPRVNALARAGQFDQAQDLVKRYLERYPNTTTAQLMLAELYLNRSDHKPELALEALRGAAPSDRAMQAQAKLDTGKAYYQLQRYDAAEDAWLEALRLNPEIPEAGWSLLDLYYLQDRGTDARRRALEQFAVEPDPRDRVQLLLELVRQDAQPTDPASIVKLFEPIVASNPGDLHSAVALGLALIKESRSAEGLALLRKVAAAHPQEADAQDAWLTGLGRAGKGHELAQALKALPGAMADSPRFARHRGQVAWDQRDWKAAAAAYRQAAQFEPGDHEVLYRLAKTLRNSGQNAEAEQVEKRARAFEKAREEVGSLYEEANSLKDLGSAPHTQLYRRLADLREKMGRYDEAIAWLKLILAADPADQASAAALKRLEAERAGSPSAGEATRATQ